uniref:Uncharacterized protein n=1 Tax=Arundo donax TaxID=35708 RepID=A0A0A9CS32_ARUDO
MKMPRLMAAKNQLKKDCFRSWWWWWWSSSSYCSAPKGSKADLTPPVPMEVRYSAAKKTENWVLVAGGHDIPIWVWHAVAGRSDGIAADTVRSTSPMM